MYTGSDAEKVALKAELTTDPNTYGYAAAIAAGNISSLVELLSRARGKTVSRGIRQGVEIMAAIDVAEFAALTQGQRDWVLALVTATGGINVGDASIRAAFLSLFNAQSKSRPKLVAVADKTTGSRLEELFGIDSTIGE